MLARIAELYVNILEPGFKIFLVVIIVAFLLYGFNLLRGADTKSSFVGVFVGGTVKIIGKTLQVIARSFVALLKLLMRTIRILMATIRDFLKSEDL